MLGVVWAADGWVEINCLTGQHWLDACDMLGLPEYGEQQLAIMTGGPERAEFFARAEALLAKQTVAEIVELSQSLRIPAIRPTTARPCWTARNTSSASSSLSRPDSSARDGRLGL